MKKRTLRTCPCCCLQAERLFRSDIRTARGFCWLMAPEQLIIFDEIERQFLTEFDYR